MKVKQVIVILLAMISFMCFGLSFNKIEAATVQDETTGKWTTDVFTADGAAEGFSVTGSMTDKGQYVGYYAGASIINTTALEIDSSKDVNVTINARKYGGPTEAQATLTIELLSANNTVLATKTISPTTTESKGYRINLTNTSGTNGAYIKITSATSSTNGKFAGIYSGKVEYYKPVTKTQLATPTNIAYNDVTKTLSWDAVENASKYSIYLLDSSANEYNFESNTNSLNVSELPVDTYSGTLTAIAALKSNYLDSNEADINDFSKTSPLFTSEKISNVVIKNNLTFTYRELESQFTTTLNLDAYWAANNLSYAESEGAYIDSITFDGVTLSSDTASKIRHWNAGGTKELRLYKSATFTLTAPNEITSVTFVGSTKLSSLDSTITGYEIKSDTIVGSGLSAIKFNVSDTDKLTGIVVKTKNTNVSTSDVRYKDFSNIILGTMLEFTPTEYNNIVSSGIIVSTSSSITTDYANTLPTDTNQNGNRIIVKQNVNNDSNYVINISFDSLLKCKDVLYIYGYVVYTNSNNEQVIAYTSVKEVSVYSMINAYLADANLSSEHTLLENFKNSIDSQFNNGGQQ